MTTRRPRPSRHRSLTTDLQAQHESLVGVVRASFGPQAHSVVITLRGSAALSVYDAHSQALSAPAHVSDETLLDLSAQAADLHGLGHWLLGASLQEGVAPGAWRPVLPTPTPLLPW